MVTAVAPPASMRRAALARLVATRGIVRVAEAAAHFDVSEVTVRSDLAFLHEAGLVIRLHGAAMAADTALDRERSVDATMSVDARAKSCIGDVTAGRVRSGQSVFLDAGSTPVAVARALVERYELDDVLIVTNSLSVALALEPAISRFEVVVTGGTLRPLQHSLVGPFAIPMLDRLHLDLAVIGCTGVDAIAGATNVNLAETEIKSSMIVRASSSVLVADGSKLGKIDRAHVAPLSAFAELITAGSVDPTRTDAIRATGMAVTVADI